ncbi:hypothetical protein E1460_23525 [Salmonella enterica subsp. enterica serovar Caracas]|nr:hypothetical protein [Salmonella enterica subsp. enterica serovar Caracas]
MIRNLSYNALVVTICFLTGCSSSLMEGTGQIQEKKTAMMNSTSPKVSQKNEVTIKPIVDEVVPVASLKSEPTVEKCARELKALKRLDARRYAQRKEQFDRLMSTASLYADVRMDVERETQESVDAMYLFRTGKLCAEISRDVWNALTRQ